MTIRSIRSRNHRRILHFLSDGPAIVSEIAQDLQMKLPHVSLACKQLRELDLIIRDESSGIRGAPFRITTNGYNRMVEDMVFHLQREKIDSIPNDRDAIILKTEGRKALIGYTKPPQTSLQRIEIGPITSLNESPQRSKGNSGGVWLACPVRRVQWFNVKTGEPTSPDEPMTGTLVDFQLQEIKIGLVWVTLFDEQSRMMLPEREWFSFSSSQQSADLFSNGQYHIGHIDHIHSYSIQKNVHANLTSPIEREIFIQRLAQSVQCFVSTQTKSSILPIQVLREWLKLKHPRLNQERIQELSLDVVKRIDDKKGRASKIVNEVRRDFPNIEFIEGEEINFLSIDSCTELGVRAIAHFLLQHTTPWLLEWNFPLPRDDLLERCIQSSHCVAIMTRSEFAQPLLHAHTTLSSTKKVGVVEVFIQRGISLEIQLEQSQSILNEHQYKSPCPQNALELMHLSKMNEIQQEFENNHDSLTVSPSFQMACALYPEGDSTFANSIELRDPLSSWVASPQNERSQRWERISQHIPHGWIELNEITELSDELLIEGFSHGGPEWQDLVMIEARKRCSIHPMFLLKVFEKLIHEQHGVLSASIILNSIQYIEKDYPDMIQQAFSMWASSPRYSKYVLPSIFPHSPNITKRRKEWFDQLIFSQTKSSQDPIFIQWQQFHTSTESNLSIECIQRSIEIFPLEWWAEMSGQWFQSLSSSSNSRDWVCQRNIPWTVLLLASTDVSQTIPGAIFTSIKRRKPTMQTVERMVSHSDGNNVHLEDLLLLYRANETKTIPECGSHPYLGWLARPVNEWPPFSSSMMDGHDHIINRFLLRHQMISPFLHR